jgi:aminoglycoside phosphotransferase (APT) family kinase protein
VSDTKFLDTWQTWGCRLKSRPVVVNELTGGQTNRSFLLDANGIRLVMRLNAPPEKFPGVDRAREARIWRAASDAKLAPPLVFVDPKERFIITEYVDGQTLNPSQLDDSLTDRLFDLLAGVHDLDVDAPALDYALYIRVNWQMIESGLGLHNPDLERQREPMQALAAEFIASKPQTGLCHHDPVISNVVSADERLYLLDWEYASRGFVAMDYAVLSVDWGIADIEIVRRTSLDPAELDMAKQTYRYICDLWKETPI